MAVSLTELLQHLDEQLEVDRFRDYCPNGLQVEGRGQVSTLVTGVTACQALIDRAISVGADAILVHHGYFWKGESPVIVGIKRRRLGALIANDISLLAYHLPLDAHPEMGNNACLGKLMGLDDHQPLEPGVAGSVGNITSLPAPVPAAEMVGRLADITGRAPLHIAAGADSVQRIAWCTGAAQGYIEAAVAAGADMFVTGEVSEQTVHTAREEGIHFVAAGHHATERYGVQALGEYLARRFELTHQFVDIDNPV
ncbi:MAG: Nif3-like dinuclear metal center hexameric protein [Halioglobus sp.]